MKSTAEPTVVGLKCDLCGEDGFNGPAHLGRHKRFAHDIPGTAHKPKKPSKKKVVCSVCGRDDFANEFGLKVHMGTKHRSGLTTTGSQPKQDGLVHGTHASTGKSAKGHAPEVTAGFHYSYEIPETLIAFVVGHHESYVERIAREHGIPTKHFAQECAKYISRAASR